MMRFLRQSQLTLRVRPCIFAHIQATNQLMNLNSYVLDQAFKQLALPESSQKQFRIASVLSDVTGNGLPSL